MITRTGAGTWSVYQGTSCTTGPTAWKLTAAAVSAPSVQVSPTAPPSDAGSSMLELCEADGTRWFRGALWAVDTGSSQATVNHLPLESYLLGVVPNESPASWGTLGGGAGEQALMAQAVAARSYALASAYAPYAKTCDTTACQVYRGRAFQPTGGAMIDEEGTAEFASTDQAVTSTAGEIRVFSAGGGGPAGTVALTEYSSSTGGYTAGGVFPAVPDTGDATASNPNHTWSATVPATTIESAFGAGLGTACQSVLVTARNGLGDMGGRVTTMTLHFTGGPVTTTGASFAGAVGLKSNWFTVTAQPGSPATSAPAASAPATSAPAASAPAAPVTTGYDVLTSDGSVYAFDGAVVAHRLAERPCSQHTTAGEPGDGPRRLRHPHGRRRGSPVRFGVRLWLPAGKGAQRPPVPAGDHARRPGLLDHVASDGGAVQLWRRPLPRLDRQHPCSTNRSSPWPSPPTGAATG